MRRFLGLLVVASMLVGIPLSHLALAKGKPDNTPTTICHLSPDVELETDGEFAGVIITIPAHAAEKQKEQGIACDLGETFDNFCNCASGGE